MCVYVYIYIFFCQIFVNFCGPATFRNENSFAVQVSVPPNLRKDIYTRKGLNTLLLQTERLNSNTFTIDL